MGGNVCHLVRGVGVQAGGRLVQEQHARVGDQRNANVGPLGLRGHNLLKTPSTITEAHHRVAAA